jgi:protein LTV1
MILNPTALPNSDKPSKQPSYSSSSRPIKHLDDLASEFGSDGGRIRPNEGEAANYGIYYDDTEYDYMQHVREIGTGGGQAVFLEAPKLVQKKDKGKSLEDALRDASLEEKKEIVLDEEILPSKNLRKVTYQAMQDVPDALAGFQPDMDPRLREVLEALEDEAYVEDDEDIFNELAKDGEELDDREFDQEAFWDEEDEGWESDATVQPSKEYKNELEVPDHVAEDEREDHGDGDWMKEFSKFKKDEKKGVRFAAAPSQSEVQSSMMTTTTNGGRKKKRKGALTNPSNYSMTSSSVFRTEGLTDLDARFEKLEEKYNEDNDMSDFGSMASSVSSVTGPMRNDFDGIMDDFLGQYNMTKTKHVRRGKYQSGMEQLDEVRKGLGKAVIRPSFI